VTVTTALPDAREPLTAEVAASTFATIIDGGADDEAIAAFLVTLADRGETVTEVAAAARAMRARAATITAPANAIDVCGTGGDGQHTRNISTAVAIVVASCGVPVAKHGNRAASSRSGAADVLAELGVRTDLDTAAAQACLETVGLTFLHAANHHGAMARVAPIRRKIGRRTIFNLLGPLANPAGVTRQLVGVFDARWVRPIAEVLRELGATRAMVVHGSDGIDDLTVGGPSIVAQLAHHSVSDTLVTPADAGLATHPLSDLRGGDPADNAAAQLALLRGAPGAYRDVVLLNAAGALIVAGEAHDWRTAATMSADAIDSGAARDLLERWKAFR
jgi:anthranilate phosphoribosyltransferase